MVVFSAALVVSSPASARRTFDYYRSWSLSRYDFTRSSSCSKCLSSFYGPIVET